MEYLIIAMLAEAVYIVPFVVVAFIAYALRGLYRWWDENYRN